MKVIVPTCHKPGPCPLHGESLRTAQGEAERIPLVQRYRPCLGVVRSSDHGMQTSSVSCPPQVKTAFPLTALPPRVQVTAPLTSIPLHRYHV